jgi:hypothetical protein
MSGFIMWLSGAWVILERAQNEELHHPNNSDNPMLGSVGLYRRFTGVEGLTMETDTQLEFHIMKIGSVELGCGDCDEVVLLKCLEDDISEQDAYDYLMPLVYRDTNDAGGYFCHRVETIQRSDNEVLCIIHHRYNT